MRLVLLLAACLVCGGTACQAQGEQGGAMVLSSPDFEPGKMVPAMFTCDGENINPALSLSGVPQGSKAVVIIVEDPDAPSGDWVHWIAFFYDVAPRMDIPRHAQGVVQGQNDFNDPSYGGPCPPSGTHRYFFRAYALDIPLAYEGGAGVRMVRKDMAGHILAQAELMALYSR